MAFDAWEKAQYEKLCTQRFLICDALSRADDGMNEDRFDTDKFHYAFEQVKRAGQELGVMVATMQNMIRHRLDLEMNQVETR